jgi:hypothetical protein
VFAIVDGFRVALPILRLVLWFCLADGFRVVLPILRFGSSGFWQATALLCHDQQARVGFVLGVGAALAAITVIFRG